MGKNLLVEKDTLEIDIYIFIYTTAADMERTRGYKTARWILFYPNTYYLHKTSIYHDTSLQNEWKIFSCCIVSAVCLADTADASRQPTADI